MTDRRRFYSVVVSRLFSSASSYARSPLCSPTPKATRDCDAVELDRQYQSHNRIVSLSSCFPESILGAACRHVIPLRSPSVKSGLLPARSAKVLPSPHPGLKCLILCPVPLLGDAQSRLPMHQLHDLPIIGFLSSCFSEDSVDSCEERLYDSVSGRSAKVAKVGHFKNIKKCSALVMSRPTEHIP